MFWQQTNTICELLVNEQVLTEGDLFFGSLCAVFGNPTAAFWQD